MKKIIKTVSLIFAAVLLALSLSSCRYLDDLKAHRVVYNGDTRSEVLMDGEIYKRVDPDNLSLIYTDSMDYNYYKTSDDVPLLLSGWFTTYHVTVSEDKTVVYFSHEAEDDNWFVREDLYDDYETVLKDPKLDRYFLNYQVYDYGDDYYGDYSSEDINVLVDETTTDVINKTLKIPDKEKIDYTKLSKGDYSQQIICVQKCDEKVLVTNNSSIYIIKDNGKYYIWDGNSYDENTICPVDEKDFALIGKLFDNYPDSVESYNISSEFGVYYYDDIYYDDVDYPER